MSVLRTPAVADVNTTHFCTEERARKLSLLRQRSPPLEDSYRKPVRRPLSLLHQLLRPGRRGERRFVITGTTNNTNRDGISVLVCVAGVDNIRVVIVISNDTNNSVTTVNVVTIAFIR